MRSVWILAGCMSITACFAAGNPFLGRWDFNMPNRNGMGATWLGVKDVNGQTEVWFQPTGGNVTP